MSSLFHLPAPNLRSATRSIQYYYWHNYKASRHAQLAGPVHRVALEKHWNEREQAGIWSQVICPVSICSKATVRRHHGRRIRDAFKEALNERGFDKHGKAIDGRTPSLQGTLHIVSQASIVQTESLELRRECALVISKIIDFNQKALGKEKVSGLGKQSITRQGHNNKFRTQNHKAQNAQLPKGQGAKRPA